MLHRPAEPQSTHLRREDVLREALLETCWRSLPQTFLVSAEPSLAEHQ